MPDDDSIKVVNDLGAKITLTVVTAAIGIITGTSTNPLFENKLLILMVTLIIVVVIWTFLNARYDRRKNESEVRDILTSQTELIHKLVHASQQTLRSNLIRDAEHYMKRGWVTSQEHRAYIEEYMAYTDLGLNGYIKIYLDRVNGLPIKELDNQMEDQNGH